MRGNVRKPQVDFIAANPGERKDIKAGKTGHECCQDAQASEQIRSSFKHRKPGEGFEAAALLASAFDQRAPGQSLASGIWQWSKSNSQRQETSGIRTWLDAVESCLQPCYKIG